jgi:hypothetical protein
METKPYSLQSPEQIAKDYGGNKQRIAEAMQMGIIDPTAGTMAGMFIDRMRMAQQQEMAPQQTVAQQVFAPPAPPMGAMPPAGLGATPQAAAMPPMPGGAPMVAPPAPPMGAPGMAAGGLTTLPLPDDMFNEPDVGGYAAGGIVAFQAGGGVGPDGVRGTADDDEEVPITPRGREGVTTPAPGFPSLDTPVTGRKAAESEPPEPKVIAAPGIDFPNMTELGGYFSDIGTNLRQQNQFSPYNTAAAEEYVASLREQLSPEARRARQQEDMWSMLGQIGARMASTPGSLLQAVSAGLGEAVPTTAAAARERRAEERQLRESILGEERTGNRERAERFAIAREMLNNFNSLDEARKDRSFNALFQSLTLSQQRELGLAEIAANLRGTGMQVGAQNLATRLAFISGQEDRRQRQELAGVEAWIRATAPGTDYATRLSLMTPAQRETERRNFISSYNPLGSGVTGAGLGGMEGLAPLLRLFGVPAFGAPPAGAVRPRE